MAAAAALIRGAKQDQLLPRRVLGPGASASIIFLIMRLAIIVGDSNSKASRHWSSRILSGEARMQRIWSERGGPPGLPSMRSGFGRTLIERGLKAALGGQHSEGRAEGLIRVLSSTLQYAAHDLS